MKQPVPYTAVISPVRETILIGAADLACWRGYLRPERLEPFEEGDRASLLVTAMESKFNGIPFRELTFSVRVGDGNAVYLAHAFNSSRLLGFAERTLFRTPYAYGPVELRDGARGLVRAGEGASAAFEARMGADAAPSARRDEVYEGPIYLPGNGREPGEMFYARLEGEAAIYPFDPARDGVVIRPEAAPVFRQLAESGFTGVEWRLRENAVHSRSKTYRRD